MSEMWMTILVFIIFPCLIVCAVLLVWWIFDKLQHRANPKPSEKESGPEVPVSYREKAVEYTRIIRNFHLSGSVTGTRSGKFMDWLEYSLKPGRHDRMKSYAYDMLVDPTAAEREFHSYLRSRGIRFIPQCICVADRAYILDFYLPDRHMAVEIDGGYHLENGQRMKDSERDRKIRRRWDIRTVRFTNSEILSGFFRCRFNEAYGITGHGNGGHKFDKIERT